MPTTRPRHMVTETDEVAAALDVAARAWPGVPRSRLIPKLLAEGGRALAAEQAEPPAESTYEERLEAILRDSGGFEDCYEPGYLEKLRAEWPQ